MSIQFSQAKLKGEERRAILQAIQTQMQQVIIDGVTQVLQEFLEQEVTTKLGRPKRSPRRMSSQARPIDWQCACCGCSDANQFTRDGHYRRSLETGWGHLDVLRVPMLECQRCKRGVKVETGLQAIVRDGSEGLEQALDYVYGSALVQRRCILAWIVRGKSPGFRKLR